MSEVTLRQPWLIYDLGDEMQVLSWVLNRPGFVRADRLIWREVRNYDLSADLDVGSWLKEELVGIRAEEAPCFLTARRLDAYLLRRVEVEGQVAECLATVGLSNAERVGTRVGYDHDNWGTINIAVRVEAGLTQAAMLEAMSIAAQARTLAVVEEGVALTTGMPTGTGTDCIAVAAPEGEVGFAGLHTALGEAIGRATYDAVRDGVRDWVDEQKAAGRL